MKKSLVVFVTAAVVALVILWVNAPKVPTDQRSAANESNNVIVILVDTLRADHLPFYGYKKNTAPFLNSLSEKSVVFERAFSASSYTAPAVASVFTSLYPEQHGVIIGFRAAKRIEDTSPELTLNRLPNDPKTIAEHFSAKGFRTFGVADNLNIGVEMGFDQGFEKFMTLSDQGADVVNKVVLNWESELRAAGKYFLYIHYMDPHHPYLKRQPWFETSADPLEQKINAYDSEISYVDEKIKELVEHFGWLENSTIIFLADHGEEFHEHGRIWHANNLYREVIHVPFFIYRPNSAPKRISEYVATMDLLPTMAEIYDFEQNHEWQGESLMPVIEGQPKSKREIISQLLRKPEQRRASWVSLIVDGWHYLEKTSKTGIKSEELYDLLNDFGEQNNKIEETAELGKSLRERLEVTRKNFQKQERNEVHIPLKSETIEQLKSLGYVD